MSLVAVADADYADLTNEAEGMPEFKSQDELDAYIAKLESDMREAAKRFEFEQAAKLRDQVRELRTQRVHVYVELRFTRSKKNGRMRATHPAKLFPRDLVSHDHLRPLQRTGGNRRITVRVLLRRRHVDHDSVVRVL